MKLKHIALSMFLLFVIALTPLMARADLTLGTNVVIDQNNPLFGSATQQASNPLDDDGAVIIKAQRSLTLKNTGAEELEDFTVSFVPNGNFILVSGDVVETSPLTFTIPAGLEGSLSLEGKIPEDLDAIDANFNEVGFEAGTLTITAKEVTSGMLKTVVVPVFMQRENKLEITDSDAEINNKRKESIDDGDDIEDIKPSDRLDIEVSIENNYDDSDEVDIENIDLVLSCVPDTDVEIDDETLDLGDLAPEDEDTDTFVIDVEENAEDRDIKCEIQALGIDENGARMGENIGFNIEISRENHDIQIQLPVLATPQVISCSDNSLQVSIGFINLGKSDEDEVAVELTSQELNYQERRSNIELDEDDTEVEIFNVPIGDRDIGGINPLAFTIRTFYDNVKTSDTETLLIENACVDDTTTGNSGSPAPEVSAGTLAVTEDFLTTMVGKFNSIAVQITNSENSAATFEVVLVDIIDFATPSSPKSVLLQPGQTSTVFLNFKTKEDTATGTYTGTINLKSGGQIIDSQLFTVEVAGEERNGSGGLGFELDSTRVFWIIGDIILIIIAIFFIRLIFTGGKKRQQMKQKKMADYESAAKKKA